VRIPAVLARYRDPLRAAYLHSPGTPPIALRAAIPGIAPVYEPEYGGSCQRNLRLGPGSGPGRPAYPAYPAGQPYRSFRGLLEHLATLTRNQVRFADTTATIPMLAEPTSTQRQAFELIDIAIPLTLK